MLHCGLSLTPSSDALRVSHTKMWSVHSSSRRVVPALGLVWANCINSRLMLSRQYTDSKIKGNLPLLRCLRLTLRLLLCRWRCECCFQARCFAARPFAPGSPAPLHLLPVPCAWCGLRLLPCPRSLPRLICLSRACRGMQVRSGSRLVAWTQKRRGRPFGVVDAQRTCLSHVRADRSRCRPASASQWRGATTSHLRCCHHPLSTACVSSHNR